MLGERIGQSFGLELEEAEDAAVLGVGAKLLLALERRGRSGEWIALGAVLVRSVRSTQPAKRACGCHGGDGLDLDLAPMPMSRWMPTPIWVRWGRREARGRERPGLGWH